MKTDISKALRRGTFCMISYACVVIMCNFDLELFSLWRFNETRTGHMQMCDWWLCIFISCLGLKTGKAYLITHICGTVKCWTYFFVFILPRIWCYEKLFQYWLDYLLRGSVPICAVRCAALQRAHLNFDCERGTAVNIWLWLMTALGMLTAELSFVGEVCTEFWWGNVRVRDHLEDPGVDGRVILKRIFKLWNGDHGLDWYSSG